MKLLHCVEPVLQLGLQNEDEEFFQTLTGKIVAVGVGTLLVIIILILITIIFISCKRGRRFRHGECENRETQVLSTHTCVCLHSVDLMHPKEVFLKGVSKPSHSVQSLLKRCQKRPPGAKLPLTHRARPLSPV